MKNLKLITAIMAIFLAIGGAFVSNAEEVSSMEDSAMLTSVNESAQLGYYRTVPSNPASCTQFGPVECNPSPVTPNCIIEVDGEAKQMYDQNCQLLYQDPIQ